MQKDVNFRWNFQHDEKLEEYWLVLNSFTFFLRGSQTNTPKLTPKRIKPETWEEHTPMSHFNVGFILFCTLFAVWNELHTYTFQACILTSNPTHK